MNWAAWGPTIVATVTMIFTAGMLVARVANQDKRLDDHGQQLDTHEGRLNEHAVAIAKAEAWREGYNAARDSSR